MVNKGGFSFVAMLVINPIVILFYQNCSMAPISHANNGPLKPVVREVASVGPKATVEVSTSGKLNCAQGKKECLKHE